MGRFAVRRAGVAALLAGAAAFGFACTQSAPVEEPLESPVDAEDVAEEVAGEVAEPATSPSPAAEAVEPEEPPEAPPQAPPPIAPEIELPPGFAAVCWIEGLKEPTALAFGPDGRLFVAERGGRLWTFRDDEGAGVAGEGVLFAEGLVELLGLAVASDGTVYLSDRGRVSVAQDADGDGRAEATAPLVAGLPVGRHQNNGIAIGPDGRLYIALGSTCNDCIEASPFSAAILALDLETRRLSVHAGGLRNPDDLVFAPDGTLWATDNGSDPPCATSDELNRIEPQSDYGWPYCQSHQPRFPRTQEPLLDLGLPPAPTAWPGSSRSASRPRSAAASTSRCSGRTAATRTSAAACSSRSWRRTAA